VGDRATRTRLAVPDLCRDVSPGDRWRVGVRPANRRKKPANCALPFSGVHGIIHCCNSGGPGLVMTGEEVR
jgi:hypothetical protein